MNGRLHAASRFALRPIVLGVLLAWGHGVSANPMGPQVTAGSASFKSVGPKLTVTNTPGTVINWDSFSIGAGERTRFKQETAASAVLNRVVGADPSSILGRLSSNGRVFLINPHGIVVGAGARIDTAGFIASTLNMADRDFLEGRFRFEGGGNGVLRNEGKIRASGDIILVGPAIENAGLIRSRHGSVVLAAGKSVTITSPDAQGVKFALQAPTDSAINVGEIEAANAVSMFAGTLKHSGEIRATTATLDGGRVVLAAQKEAIVQSGGVISVAGANGGSVVVQSGDLSSIEGHIDATGNAGEGGTVHVLGNRVAVQSGARIDASGQTGGGTILVGGDYQGRNPEVQNAWRTFVGSGSTLRADAIDSGDGGKVVVWADDSTRFDGAISARGGAVSGNGGFVETSGKQTLSVTEGRVDTRAPAGHIGKWLLDPQFIVVGAAGALPPGNTVAFGDGVGLPQLVSAAAISAAMSDVTLQANTDITFSAGFPISIVEPGVGLTAQAGRSILVNADITTNSGTVRLIANEATVNGVVGFDRMAGAAELTMANGVNINAGGADVFLRIGNGLGHDGTSGNITVHRITASNISFAHEGPTANGSIVRTDGTALLTAATSIDFSHTPAGAGGSIGKPGEPIPIATQRLEAHLTQAAGGIFIDNTGDLQIGDAVLMPGGIRGVQALAGGPIQLTTSGNLTRAAGPAGCGPSPGTGGPICAIGVDGNVTLNAAALGAAGPAGRLHVDVNGGAVSGTTSVGGIFLEQRNGDARLSDYNMVLPPGQPIELATGNGRFTVDTSLTGPTLPLTLSSGGPAAEIVFNGGVTLTAASLALEGSGPVVFNAGTVNLNAPVTASAPVSVGGGTANFNFPSTIAGVVTLSSGTLGGTGAVSVGTLTWTGGTLASSGGVTVGGSTSLSTGAVKQLTGSLETGRIDMGGGPLQIAPGAELTIGGIQPSGVNAAAIENEGTIRLGGAGPLTLSNGASILNNGNFFITGDAIIQDGGGTQPTFTNNGLVRKFGPGTGTSTIGDSGAITFTNGGDGAIEVLSGTLAFSPGTFTANAGAIEIAFGASLVTGALANTSSGLIGGGGTLDLGGATLVNNGILRPGPPVGAAGTLTVTGNLQQEPSGRINVTIDGLDPGAVDRLAVSGSAALAGTLNVFHLDGFSPSSDSAYTILTAGAGITGDFTTKNFPAGYETFYTGAPTAGSYALSIGDVVNQWIGTSGTWHNQANWSLGHAPTPGEDVVIDVDGATVRTIGVPSGSQAARSVMSQEDLLVNGGALTIGTGASDINAAFTVSSGSAVVLGPLTANSLTVSGGSAVLSGLFAADSTTLSGGILSVSGPTLTNLTMSGGTVTRTIAGNLTIAGVSAASGGAIALSNPGVDGVVNAGVLNLSGTIDLGGSDFTNTGTLNINTADATPLGTTAGTQIANSGTLNKNGPDFVNLFHPFSNSAAGLPGTVNVNEGILSVAFGGSQNGTIEIRPSGTLNTDGSLINNGTIGGRGSIELFTGTLTNNGIVRPGTIDGVTGTLTITNGNFTNAAGGNLNIRLGGQGAGQFDALAVGGTANLGGMLNLSTTPGYTATDGDIFTIVSANTVAGDFATTNKTNFANGINVLNRPTFYLIGLGSPTVNSWISETSGAWDDASRWSLAHAPLPNEQVFIDRPTNLLEITIPPGVFEANSLRSRETIFVNGTLGLATASSVDGALQINPGGVLTGTGAITLAGLSLSGTIAGTGGVTVTGTTGPVGNSTISGSLTAANEFLMVSGGTLNILNGGSLILSGAGEKTFAGGATVTASGTFAVDGTRTVELNGGSTINVTPTGRLEFRSGAGLDTTGGAAGSLTNFGTIAKTGGGSATIGSVNLNFLNSGGTLDAVAGTLVYAANSTFNDESLFNGGGTHAIAGSSTFNDDMRSAGGLTLRSGSFTGNATLHGPTTWTGGTIGGTFTVPAGAVLGVTGPGAKVIDAGASLTNSGTTALSGGAAITGAGTFQNNTVLDSAGAGADTSIVAVFNNAGTVNVDGGTFRLTGNGADSGTYAIDAGATLDIAGGSRIFAPSVALPSGGTLRLSAGSLDVQSGILPKLDLAADGVLTNSTGNLTITGAFNVSGGAILGPGTLTTAGTTTITGTVNPARSWVNNGILNLDAGQISPSPGAGITFTNAGTLNINTSNPAPFSLTSDMPITNSGTINKNAAGNAEIFDAYTNTATGTLNVDAGRLILSSAPVTQAGVVNIASGAFLSTGGDALTNTGTLGGAGTVELAGNTLTNSGRLRPGGPAGGTVSEIGTLTIDGNLTQTASGAIDLQLAGAAADQADRLVVTGSAALAGTLAVSTLGAYTPATGDAFTALTGASRAGSFGALTKTFANDLAPAYSATSVTVTVGTPNDNTWISDASGSWDDAARWSQSRVPLATDRVRINQPGDLTITIPSGPHGADSLTSEESITLAGGLGLGSPSTVNALFTITGGTLSGPGALTVNGPLSLNAATLEGIGGVTVNGTTAVTGGASQLIRSLTTSGFTMLGGSLSVGSDGVLNLVGASAKTVSGATLDNAGAVNIEGSGDVTLTDGALWDNSRTVNIGGASRIVLGGGGAATLINRGTGVITDSTTNATPITIAGAPAAGKAFANAGKLVKAVASADVQTVNAPMTNTGEIDVLAGTLVATAFPSNSGIIDLEPGTTFSTAGAPLTNNAFGLLKGNGTLNLGGATFTNNGTVGPGASPGRLIIAGNYLQGPGGTLVVELGGTLAGIDYDVLQITGSARLDGNLVILQSPGVTIGQGSAYEFLTYASSTGDFSAFAAPPGFSFQTSPGPTSYTATNTVAIPPTFVQEVSATSQNEVARSNDRDTVLLTDTADNTDAGAEKRKLGECR